eukprot:XP_011518067.1 proline-rich protein 26 isoform X1 [Homo sapiens]
MGCSNFSALAVTNAGRQHPGKAQVPQLSLHAWLRWRNEEQLTYRESEKKAKGITPYPRKTHNIPGKATRRTAGLRSELVRSREKNPERPRLPPSPPSRTDVNTGVTPRVGNPLAPRARPAAAESPKTEILWPESGPGKPSLQDSGSSRFLHTGNIELGVSKATRSARGLSARGLSARGLSARGLSAHSY